ncbi:MAG: enoyl-CoA hydratase/isomerase family protein [Acidobacteria bacterium]|nr:enoyl-CoA hydratase/isomerase family protein [Acidobacteriota bacterium]
MPSTPDIAEIVFDDGGMNLLSRANIGLLRARFESLRGSDAVIFRSGREKIFAAGADMKEMLAFTPFDAWEFSRAGQELMETIEHLEPLTIALVDGDCFGGALDLLMAFDLRIATPESRFSHPGARIGIVTGFGGTSRWRRIARPSAASKLFLENRVFSAKQAKDLGLLTHVTDDPDSLLDRELRRGLQSHELLRPFRGMPARRLQLMSL